MLRGIAIVLLVISCGLLGFTKSKAESGRIKDLKMLRRMTSLISGAVSYGAVPLPSALWSVGGKMGNPYKEFMQQVSKELDDLSGVCGGGAVRQTHPAESRHILGAGLGLRRQSAGRGIASLAQTAVAARACRR